MSIRRPSRPLPPASLARRLDAALDDAALAGERFDAGGGALADLSVAEPVGRRDALVTLLLIHDLHVAPIDRLGPRVHAQHHPAVAVLKRRLEARLLDELDAADRAAAWDLPAGAPAALRALAVADLVPDVYRWVADTAAPHELVEFLALEGGPDAGFDDLVAVCQLGLGGVPKVELARNYWDEMGNGLPGDVHTELHHRLVGALGLPAIPRSEQPLEALERSALGSLLATNRALQPEMVGALGLIELQAGPRCRKVLQGLTRVGAPAGAFPFYEVHADVDPRHGKDWVDHVVAPLAADPAWAAGIVRGARWRSLVNARFFAAMADRFLGAAAHRRAS
jgi:hypothetical protein